MPIHNGVHPRVCGIFDAVLDQGFQRLLVPTAAIAAVFLRVHGKAHHIRTPVVELAEAVGVDVLGKPSQAMGADAPQLHRHAALVHELGPLHMERPRLLLPRRQRGYR